MLAQGWPVTRFKFGVDALKLLLTIFAIADANSDDADKSARRMHAWRVYGHVAQQTFFTTKKPQYCLTYGSEHL